MKILNAIPAWGLYLEAVLLVGLPLIAVFWPDIRDTDSPLGVRLIAACFGLLMALVFMAAGKALLRAQVRKRDRAFLLATVAFNLINAWGFLAFHDLLAAIITVGFLFLSLAAAKAAFRPMGNALLGQA